MHAGGVSRIACIFGYFILFLFYAAANFDFRFVDVAILDIIQTLRGVPPMQVALMRCITVLREVPLGRGIDGEHLYSWGD